MKFAFKEWLMNENQTVAQFLKQKGTIANIKQAVVSFLSRYTIPPKVQSVLVNWFTKELIISGTQPEAMVGFMDNMWQNVGDYIIHHINNNKFISKLNTMELTYADMVDNANQWHTELKNNQKAQPGATGIPIIELDRIGWKGWKWVSLDKRYCATEGKAMGHCGNGGGKPGDNILSLRDPKNIPKLTFIVNNGTLGESKGAGNSKPSPKYHPVIIELLKSDYIKVIGGGGFMPDNNFQLRDLPENLQQLLLQAKPHINDIVKKRIEDYDQLQKLMMNNSTNENVVNIINKNFARKIISLTYDRTEYRINSGVKLNGHHNEYIQLYDKFDKFQKEDNSKELKYVKDYNGHDIAKIITHSYWYDLKLNKIKLDNVKFSSLFIMDHESEVEMIYAPQALAELIKENTSSEHDPDIIRSIKDGIKKEFSVILNPSKNIYDDILRTWYENIKQEIDNRPKPVESDWVDGDW